MSTNDDTAAKIADVQDLWSKTRGHKRSSSVDALVLRAGLTVARFSASDLLLDVDGGASLEQARDAATANGAFFPLLAAPGDRAIAVLAASHPLFVDGFVSHADAIDLSGRDVSTPAAPRSAQGPDLLGALLCQPPLALCARARVRCASMTTMSMFHLQAASAAAAASAVLHLVREAHAFSIWAEGTDVTVVAKEVPKALRPLIVEGRKAVLPTASPSGVMLSPFHLAPMVAALEDGAGITAAPQMGRVSRTAAAKPMPLVAESEATDAIHSALVQGAQESQW